MDLAKLLCEQLPGFAKIEEAPLILQGATVGWECVYLDKQNQQLGGAVHQDRETCRRIGLAETLERHYFHRITVEERQAFRIDDYPSTCGFAFGYEPAGTEMRSKCEALERWVWSKWIDENCKLPNVKMQSASNLTRYFSNQFESIEYYSKVFSFEGHEIEVAIALGFKDGGVFPGSRAVRSGQDPWLHALSESFRHYQIFTRVSGRPQGLVEKRIVHFGSDAEAAVAQVERAFKQEWPQPRLQLARQYGGLPSGLFLFRSLCANYKGWHEGDHLRFVY